MLLVRAPDMTFQWRMIGLPMAYHALGRKAESDAALAALIAKSEKAPYGIAYVCAFRGEAGKAFEWLDKAMAVEIRKSPANEHEWTRINWGLEFGAWFLGAWSFADPADLTALSGRVHSSVSGAAS